MKKGELKQNVVNFITGLRQDGVKANATLPDDFFDDDADDYDIIGDVRIHITVTVD